MISPEQRRDMAERTVPLTDVPEALVARLVDLGGPPGVALVESYQTLANQPNVLIGWMEMAWRLRNYGVTDRRLRELVILRCVGLADATVERRAHETFARELGVRQEELDAVSDWSSSSYFSPAERSALALADAMVAGDVPDEVLAELKSQFDPASRVELIVTIGFYIMLPRVNEALRIMRHPDMN